MVPPVRRPSALCVLSMLFVAMAGCLSDDAPIRGEADDSTAPVVETPQKTAAGKGVLIGTVVSDAIVPIEGASVAIKDLANTTTDHRGRYVFEDLEPGTYTVFAQAAGHDIVTHTIEVKADTIVEKGFILPRAPQAVPHIQLLEWTGFLECQIGLGTNNEQGTTANCLPIQNIINQFDLPNPTNTHQVHKWHIDREGLQAVVVEMVWTPPDNTFAKEMQLLFESDDSGLSGGDYGRAVGPSPLKIESTPEAVTTLMNDTAEMDEPVFQTRVFPAPMVGNVVFQQKFTIYTSLFYYGLPLPGYTGIPDA